MSEDIKTIVIDIGSKFSRIGFSGDSDPYSIVHTFVGQAKYVCSMSHVELLYYGDKAYDKYPVMIPFYPVKRGIIVDWVKMELFLKYLFENELRANISEHPVLFTEIPFNPKSNREKIIELMFETYNTPSFFMKNQAVLSLLSSGRNTGVVVESGDEITNIVPIYEGNQIQDSIKRINLGGRDITNNLIKLLENRGYDFNSNIFLNIDELFNNIKEQKCFVSYDYENDMKRANDYNFHYKDDNGFDLQFNKELFMCSEILFNQNCEGNNDEGIDKEIYKSIKKCDEKIQSLLYNNIVLSGGNSMLKGFPERITKELKEMTKNENIGFNIICPENRKDGSWIGGSIFSSNTDIFNKIVIKRSEYDEVGARIVNVKCI